MKINLCFFFFLLLPLSLVSILTGKIIQLGQKTPLFLWTVKAMLLLHMEALPQGATQGTVVSINRLPS